MVSFYKSVGHLVLTPGGENSRHEYNPSDYDLSTFPADSMGRPPESRTALHANTEDHETKFVELPPQTRAPAPLPHLCPPLKSSDIGIFA